jgi:hypothetical protein
MNQNKIKKAAFLLDEIGNVSDVYLQEALTYRKRKANARSWIAAVACILVVVLVGGGVLTSPLFGNILGGGFNKAENPEAAGPEVEKPAMNPSETTKPTVALDSYLSENRATLNCTAIQEGNVTFFGATYLLLQYEDDETLYRSRDLTKNEVARILDLVNDGTDVGASSPALLCRVWLVCEDGTVLSPYLKNTDGNKGFAMLFDYEAEILPSSYLISCISDILN